MTEEKAWELIDKLYRAAGLLSDIQELGVLSEKSYLNNSLNTSKLLMFDVIQSIDPRKNT